MFVVCWSVKGGSGTTVVAAALALRMAAVSTESALLVDLAGDAAAVLGIAEPAGPGISEWLTTKANVGGDSLGSLATAAAPGLDLLHRGAAHVATPTAERWAVAAEQLCGGEAVVVDGGQSPPQALLDRCDASLLVIRPCFLALRRAAQAGTSRRPTGVVIVREPGRALGRRDVEQVVGAPVVAEVPLDPAVARAVDAGLLAARLPATLCKQLRGVA
jgi:MinD superfamily P-loop ATPase